MATLNELLTTNNENAKRVADYLRSVNSFSDRVFLTQEPIDKCWEYICSEAKKLAVKGCAVLSDEDVFGLAVHFYDETMSKPKLKKPQVDEEPKEQKAVEAKPKKKKVEKAVDYEELTLF